MSNDILVAKIIQFILVFLNFVAIAYILLGKKANFKKFIT